MNLSEILLSLKWYCDQKNHKSRILAVYYVFNTNISFTFQAIKNLSALPTYLCFGPFCKFFGDFLTYLEINSFS